MGADLVCRSGSERLGSSDFVMTLVVVGMALVGFVRVGRVRSWVVRSVFGGTGIGSSEHGLNRDVEAALGGNVMSEDGLLGGDRHSRL